jgi:hypothetical protein
MSARKTYVKRKTKAYPISKIGGMLLKPEDTIVSLRKRAKLPPISKWKEVRTTSGGKIFRLPNGKEIIVKPHYFMPVANAKIAVSEKGKSRDVLGLCNELVKRRVKIEIPLGEIITRGGRTFYITQVVKGATLARVIFTVSKDVRRAIVKRAAKTLAQVHSKGVIHGHPHNLNWIMDSKGGLRLIDVKHISFKEEYPWNTRLGRTITFDGEREKDLLYFFDGMSKGLRQELLPLFRETYAKHYKAA